MNFEELRDTIAKSKKTDWHKINRIGPTYRDRFGYWTGADGSGVTVDSHVTVAVYRPDIDLTIAYGMSETQNESGGNEPDFKWSEAFPDKKVREISVLDVFWGGSLVDRLNYVYVDGARGILPLGSGHQGLRITRYDYTVARLLSDIEGLHEFSRYYDAVPFEYED